MHLRFLKSENEKGFTLLEVVIAMAIMALAFSSILAVEGGAIRASARAKQLNVVAMLAKNQMVEMEYNIEGRAFDEIKKEEEGAFLEPYQDYRWKRVVKELKFPKLGGAPSGGAGNDGGENAITDQITKLLTNYLSKAIREISVTVSWKQGKGEQSFTLTSYWVNLNHEFSLTE